MIKIVGDVNYTDGFFDTGFGIGSSLKGKHNPFKYIRRNKSDIWIGNFECVASDKSNKDGIYSSQFRISQEDLEHISHLDLYNVSNNHVMQHGDEAYEDMCSYLQSKDCKLVGKDVIRTNLFNYEGKTFGVLAFSQREEKYTKKPLYWYNPEYSEIKREYEKIEKSDYKIAYVHWGNEFINRPYADQVFLAHYLIDCGFDLVVGAHPHVLQGYEVFKGKYIFYSLGNFLFNMPTEATRYSAVINLDIEEKNGLSDLIVSYEYVKIEDDNFPKIIENEKVPDIYTFDYLNTLIYPLVENELYYREVFYNIKAYRKRNIRVLIENLYRFKVGDIIGVFKDYFRRRFK